jgi:hypothetical protein
MGAVMLQIDYQYFTFMIKATIGLRLLRACPVQSALMITTTLAGS